MEKKRESRMIDIIEDHVRICDVLSQVSHAMRCGGRMPNYIPVLNDASVTDILTDIIEALGSNGRWKEV